MVNYRSLILTKVILTKLRQIDGEITVPIVD